MYKSIDVVEKMGRMSLATTSIVVSPSKNGYQISKIQKHLENEGTRVSKESLYLLLKKYEATGSVADR
jgi:DNA-binding PadR family transcriptional regulator